MNISVDETMYNYRNTNVYKDVSKQHKSDYEEPDNHSTDPQPFLLSGSKVLTGSGRAIVCSVGENTRFYRTS